MSKNDWQSVDDLGESIQNIVNSGDLSGLNDKVTKSVNQAFDTLDQKIYGTYRNDSRTGNRASHWNNTSGTQNSSYHSEYNTTGTKYASGRVPHSAFQRFPWRDYPERYLDNSGDEVKSILEIAGGAIAAGWGVLCLGSGMLFSALLGIGTSLLVPAVVTAAGAGLVWHGVKGLTLSKRYKKYAKALEAREYCKVADLAAACGTNEEDTRKDLRKIIKKRWLKQGHLDQTESTLMVTNASFNQYTQAYQSSVARQAEEEKAKRLREQAEQAHKAAEEQKAQNAALSEEARKVIAEGRAYVEEIKRCNRNIPGFEISEKISKLELVCEQIFNRVEEHPELIDDLRKFMKYYLPTTVKLLQTYESLEQESVQGENIKKSKAEIEKTLDTINTAFENLLNGFFESDVVDIKSDISVMQTMMAQEGLLNDDMNKKVQAGH